MNNFESPMLERKTAASRSAQSLGEIGYSEFRQLFLRRPQGGKTLLTLQQTVSESLAKRTGAHPSWIQMLDRLAEVLAGQAAA